MNTISDSRRWRFRLLAILLGLLPFLLLEVGLRTLGIPSQPSDIDPFVDLHHLEALFENKPDSPGRLWIPEKRRRFFRPAEFEVKKGNQLRVFALGGSTTQGEPYSTETAFPIWMGLCLEAATTRDVEVINCGGLSYASYRVLAILQEVLDHDPDLIVVYTGHNEYLERRTYAGFEKDSFPRELGRLGQHSNLVRWISQSLAPPAEEQSKDRTELAQEVDALLDYQGGLEEYHRGAAWSAGIEAHFAWNLKQIVTACRTAGVPLVFVSPVSNLLDCPPFKTEAAPELPQESRSEFEEFWAIARQSESMEEAQEALEKALQIDPDHAGANYIAGRLSYEQREFDQALEFLKRARDKDVCPLRATSEIEAIVRNTMRSEQIPWLDASELFASRSPHQIVGDQWLVDHIHPSVTGHQWLGEELAQLVLNQGWFRIVNSDWETRVPTIFEAHLAELGEDYFIRAKQRLEGLQLWAQGRANKLREKPRQDE